MVEIPILLGHDPTNNSRAPKLPLVSLRLDGNTEDVFHFLIILSNANHIAAFELDYE